MLKRAANAEPKGAALRAGSTPADAFAEARATDDSLSKIAFELLKVHMLLGGALAVAIASGNITAFTWAKLAIGSLGVSIASTALALLCFVMGFSWDAHLDVTRSLHRAARALGQKRWAIRIAILSGLVATLAVAVTAAGAAAQR